MFKNPGIWGSYSSQSPTPIRSAFAIIHQGQIYGNAAQCASPGADLWESGSVCFTRDRFMGKRFSMLHQRQIYGKAAQYASPGADVWESGFVCFTSGRFMGTWLSMLHQGQLYGKMAQYAKSKLASIFLYIMHAQNIYSLKIWLTPYYKFRPEADFSCNRPCLSYAKLLKMRSN